VCQLVESKINELPILPRCHTGLEINACWNNFHIPRR
jgi:hypothetical protein